MKGHPPFKTKSKQKRNMWKQKPAQKLASNVSLIRENCRFKKNNKDRVYFDYK